MKHRFIVWMIPLLFLIASFLTLPHYGISWDEPIHFSRGSAYLHYFLTGKLDYSNLENDMRRSYYQDLSQNGRYFLSNDSGHPPLNGILAAASNFILYQKLGILGDIESFHLFNVLSATLLVFIVTLFAFKTYGSFAALVAGIIISTYPLFFAEGHFNIKDPAEAAFFGSAIYAFWYALKKYDWRFVLLFAIFSGLALGTKFNILFLPFIIFPWLILRFGKNLISPWHVFRRWPLKFSLVCLGVPFIIGAIFFFSWPYLWDSPIEHTLNIFRYYKEIGTGGRGQADYLIAGGWNLFPSIWIIITTPPLVLLLTTIGVLSALLFHRKEEDKTSFLWIFWLLIPLLRVSVPNSSIYGGVRQIMEFVPAMALLSGLGAVHLSQWLKRIFPQRLQLSIWQVVIVTLFIPHLLVILKLHPNENVYFNSLIGGLKGASDKNIPYFGNSFGNTYFQAVQWLNSNAPRESRVALVQGTMVNIPKIYFRDDIHFSNSFWSGADRKGEYLVDLTHQGYQMAYPFVWEYVENILEPVYEVKVDGVTIAKIWKNDIEHSKQKFKTEQEIKIDQIKQSDKVVELYLGGVYSLAHLNVQFDPSRHCEELKLGVVQTSVDGKNWRVADEKIGDSQVKEYPSLEDGVVRYLFPGNQAKYLKIEVESEKSCLFQNTRINLKGFKS